MISKILSFLESIKDEIIFRYYIYKFNKESKLSEEEIKKLKESGYVQNNCIYK